MITSVLTAIIAVAKAVPQVKAMLDQLIELYLNSKDNQSESEDEAKQAERLALLNSMKRAVDDSERKVIARLLMRNYRR